MFRTCVYMHSRFVENHPIRILKDGPLISEVVLSQRQAAGTPTRQAAPPRPAAARASLYPTAPAPPRSRPTMTSSAPEARAIARRARTRGGSEGGRRRQGNSQRHGHRFSLLTACDSPSVQSYPHDIFGSIHAISSTGHCRSCPQDSSEQMRRNVTRFPAHCFVPYRMRNRVGLTIQIDLELLASSDQQHTQPRRTRSP
jgi:hypothetical protein